jgi:hypothetical protein
MRERENKKYMGSATHYILRRETAKFTAMRVPKQFPLVLLVKVGW